MPKCVGCGEDFPNTHLVYVRIRYSSEAEGSYCDQCFPEVREEEEE